MDKIFEEEIDVFALTKEEARKYYDNLYNKIKNEGKDINFFFKYFFHNFYIFCKYKNFLYNISYIFHKNNFL